VVVAQREPTVSRARLLRARQVVLQARPEALALPPLPRLARKVEAAQQRESGLEAQRVLSLRAPEEPLVSRQTGRPATLADERWAPEGVWFAA
jgi:hypothetical protein